MKIDYTRYAWFDEDVVETVLPHLQENPEMGRPTLSKRTGLGMYKCEKVLDIWRDYDLYQYLDAEFPLSDIMVALELGPADEEEEEDEAYDPFDDFGTPTADDESRFEPEDRYVYSTSTDEYIVTLRFSRDDIRVVTVPGETHRAMRAAYSDWDGNRQTLNQIAKEFGVSRRWFYSYKTAMGWTHDQDPFTDAEVEANDPEELTKRAIQRKRHTLEKKYLQAQAEQDKRDAEKFRKLEALVLEPLAQRLAESLPSLTIPSLDLATPSEEFAAVVSPMDLHYGKLGLKGFVSDPYDRDEAEERLTAATEKILRDVALFGRPEEIIVGMAGDWFHVDNAFMGTTRGTRQDVDGHAWQVVDGGCNLAYRFIAMLRQVTDRVRTVKVSGNHDSWSTMFLIKFLQAAFANDPGVEFVMSGRQRTYVDYGATLMGFTHGDHWSPRRTIRKILTEPPREMLAKTVDRVWFTGHKHFEDYRNDNGVFWYQLPSLSGDDQYHDDEAYTDARKALSSFIVRKESGIVGNLLAPHRQN